MKKKSIAVALCGAMLLTMTPAAVTEASQAGSIDRKLKDLQQEMRKAEQVQQNADAKAAKAAKSKKKTQADMKAISGQIESKVAEMTKVSLDIDKTELKLSENAFQLEEANRRIDERSKMLDTRVKLMYTSGNVSYLDVIFSATSFKDFLDRLDSLEMIANQDQKILEDHEKDKLLVIEKKKEIEQDLKRVKSLYAQLDETKQDLMQKEREKEVMIASLDKQIEEAHGLSEEQDKMLVEFAMERSKLLKEKAAEDARRKREAAERAKKSTTSYVTSVPTYSGGKLAVPLKDGYTLTSRFGGRSDPITGRASNHSGIDMAAPSGTPIYAAEGGTVIMAELWNGYGNTVIIDHGNGLWTLYGHIRNGGIKVSKGDVVSRGQKIAEVGTTGRSTGNHLHFEVRLNGNKVDPENYLNG
ncbi:murein hydrolase activator EnvC family protein [Paenibacillus assamensis]|uniref:murein hydrolase activator EnvC family protein n=1 Tax=Paenibacillus assamensis TaxID=311244 RepID=UPI00041ED73A|nr:peptidoglycan DD-metalloendopeptidase family protein [Paenibacillus assamensis]